MKIHLKNLNFFYPPLQGVYKFAKTLYKPKKNHCVGEFDSSNEAFWCTDYNTKNPSSLQGPIYKKREKKTAKKNGHS